MLYLPYAGFLRCILCHHITLWETLLVWMTCSATDANTNDWAESASTVFRDYGVIFMQICPGLNHILSWECYQTLGTLGNTFHYLLWQTVKVEIYIMEYWFLHCIWIPFFLCFAEKIRRLTIWILCVTYILLNVGCCALPFPQNW